MKKLQALALVAAFGLASCDFLKTTPFPGYIDRTDISLDLSDRIEAIAGGESQIGYDLQTVTADGRSPRLLLLVEPPSTDKSGAFDYKGKLLVLDEDLVLRGQAGVASSIDYFSKPYSYTHDGSNILAGYTVLTQEGESTLSPPDPPKLGSPHGLEGCAFSDGANTYLFSIPSGKYTAFELSYRTYFEATWGIGGDEDPKPIIPAAARPSPGVQNYQNLGYQLMGLHYNADEDETTFVFSEPTEKRILAVRVTRAAAISGNPLLGYAGSWPVPASAWPIRIEADRPKVAICGNGLFLARRDGWMEFYPWTETGPLALSGETVRIAGDRALERPYAFLDEGPGEDAYMYRFDPASKILTRYKEWWR